VTQAWRLGFLKNALLDVHSWANRSQYCSVCLADFSVLILPVVSGITVAAGTTITDRPYYVWNGTRQTRREMMMRCENLHRFF
jgi:hypothetical protein